MLFLSGSNWLSYFLCGAIAVVVSWATSGCRLGNDVVPAAASPNPDQFTGYYVTLPQTLTFTVTTATAIQKPAPLTLIPSQIAQFITNPVALVMQNLTTGSAALTSPTGTSALPVNVNPDSTLSYQGSTTPKTFWVDPACQEYIVVTESGKVVKNTSVLSPLGNTLALSGSLQITIQVSTQFSGSCGGTFQSIADCYNDATQCGGTDSTENQQLQTQVVANFDPYIQTQTMVLADIPNIVNYSYEVSYQ